MNSENGRNLAESQQDRAYHQLRDDLLNGEIPPAAKLQISNLKDRYHTSVGPVREALSRLAAEGMLEKKGQRGYWAAPVSLEEFRDITRLRAMLEVDALRRSIVNGDLDWEAEVVGSMHRLTSVNGRDTEKPDDHSLRLVQENIRFHMALIANCRSDWQARFVSSLYDHAQRYWKIAILKRDSKAPVLQMQEHERILELALDRDADGACRLLTQHIEGAARNVIKTVFGIE